MRITASFLVSITLLLPASPVFAYRVDQIPGLAGARSGASSSSTSSLQSQEIPPVPSIVLPAGPNDPLTRAAFTRMVVKQLFPSFTSQYCFAALERKDHADFSLLFTDVSIKHPDAKYLCMSLLTGIAKGYRDGSFRPDQLITFAEASAILSRAYVLAPYADMNTKMAWYMPHAEALAARNVIPLTIKGFGHLVTDTETREMLDRLAEQITWKPSLTLEEVKRGKPFKAVVEVKN